ncbi:MAG TPA: hypothetical protein VFY89_00480, partial [Ktedonobacterales bacterium]
AHPGVRLIAAGDITSLEQIRRLASAGLDGVVLGRALYDGTLDLAAALRVAAETAVEATAVEATAVEAMSPTTPAPGPAIPNEQPPDTPPATSADDQPQ